MSLYELLTHQALAQEFAAVPQRYMSNILVRSDRLSSIQDNPHLGIWLNEMKLNHETQAAKLLAVGPIEDIGLRALANGIYYFCSRAVASSHRPFSLGEITTVEVAAYAVRAAALFRRIDMKSLREEEKLDKLAMDWVLAHESLNLSYVMSCAVELSEYLDARDAGAPVEWMEAW